MSYELFTDGGCHPNPGGPGASAFIIKRGGCFLKQGVEAFASSTNNRCELSAAILGLREVPEGESVTLYCDSQYVTKGLSERRHSWARHGWRGIANDDLWRELADLADARDVRVEWVRGHSGHPENEDCDRLCTAAYRGRGA